MAFFHICSGAVIGKNCSIGQNVLIADKAILGDGVKIQNNVAIYCEVTVEDDVFLGPSCVLTNVSNPRSQVCRKTCRENFNPQRCYYWCQCNDCVCGVTGKILLRKGAGSVLTKDRLIMD